MFNTAEFFKTALENAVALVPIVLALVTFLGQLGLAGNGKLIASMVTGLVLGVTAQIAELGVPTGFAGYFALVVYGLVVGLVASGVYDTGKGIAQKVIADTYGGPAQGRD